MYRKLIDYKLRLTYISNTRNIINIILYSHFDKVNK